MITCVFDTSGNIASVSLRSSTVNTPVNFFLS